VDRRFGCSPSRKARGGTGRRLERQLGRREAAGRDYPVAAGVEGAVDRVGDGEIPVEDPADRGDPARVRLLARARSAA
jgi:hypothetical protein